MLKLSDDLTMTDFLTNQYPKHFTLAEVLSSATAKKLGISNMPNWEQLLNIYMYLKTILEPIRIYYGKPIYINSMYRNSSLNSALNGSKTSAHLQGLACDFTTKNAEDNNKLIDYIVDNINFDQLIIYPTFIHLGIKQNQSLNRKQIIYKS